MPHGAMSLQVKALCVLSIILPVTTLVVVCFSWLIMGLM
jgi:hypothetical protein